MTASVRDHVYRIGDLELSCERVQLSCHREGLECVGKTHGCLSCPGRADVNTVEQPKLVST